MKSRPTPGMPARMAGAHGPAVKMKLRSLGQNTVTLSEGSIKHSYISTKTIRALMPTDTIGSAGPTGVAPRSVTVIFDGGSFETDVIGTKSRFRNRAGPGVFFKETGAKPGDSVRLHRVASHVFAVQLERRDRP